MYDIVGLGELLIDFTMQGRSNNDMLLFEQNPGGAPCNMLCAAARQGRKTAFIGKVGNDMHGVFLKRTLEKEGIDTSGLIMADDVFTTLAFVAINEKGERSFSFARKPGADTCLTKQEIHKGLLTDCRVFHFGSLSLTDEPARSATLEAAALAKKSGAVISYDPNYRKPLWKTVDEAIEKMRMPLKFTDMIKISDEEAELVTGYADPQKAIGYLLETGIKCAAVTLGEKGAVAGLRGKGTVAVKGKPSQMVVDTTGAGDAFWGGFISAFLSMDKNIDDLSVEDVKRMAEVGNATAALCIQKRGGIPAMPAKEAVEERLKNY